MNNYRCLGYFSERGAGFPIIRYDCQAESKEVADALFWAHINALDIGVRRVKIRKLPQEVDLDLR